MVVLLSIRCLWCAVLAFKALMTCPRPEKKYCGILVRGVFQSYLLTLLRTAILICSANWLLLLLLLLFFLVFFRFIVDFDFVLSCLQAKASAYSMAKCALRQLAKTAALELAPEKINVNVIQPGYVDLRMLSCYMIQINTRQLLHDTNKYKIF